MKIQATNEQDRLGEVQSLYERARSATTDKHLEFDSFDKQYRGDSFIDPKDGKEAEKADVVWNISFELLEGSIDTNIPQPFVTPEFKCEHNIRNARRIENLLKLIMDKQPWEAYNDEQERTVKKFGTAGMNVEWDVTLCTNTIAGEAAVIPLRPQHIYPQPNITDIKDCDYVFVDYITTRSELKRKYSLDDEDVEKTAFTPTEATDEDDALSDEDVVTLTVCWYINESGDVCRFVYSGCLVLEDDSDYYSRKTEYCEGCGRRRQLCEMNPCSEPSYYMNTLDYDEITEPIHCSDGRVIPAYSPVIKNGGLKLKKVKRPVTNPDGSQAMDIVGGVEVPAFVEVLEPVMRKTRLPFYKPRSLPVAIRYNIRDDKSFWGISDMEIIRPHQQACNKLSSRINEAVMKSGAALMIPEDAKLTPSNTIFDDIIEVPANADKNQYGLYSYAVDISQWVVERANHKDQAKRILGISDSFLGQADNTAKSGYAKTIQVQQAAGRLASKNVMKKSHFADIFRVIFELYLAFADEPRQIHHDDNSDEDCLNSEELFNRFDFYEFDFITGEWYINDNYTFAIDQNGAIEHQYPQLWDIIKSDFTTGMYGDPSQIDTQICVWRHLEKLRYPFAREIVEQKKGEKERMMQVSDNMMGQGANGGDMLQGGAPQMPAEGDDVLTGMEAGV